MTSEDVNRTERQKMGQQKDGMAERQANRMTDGKNAGMREEAEIPGGGFPLLFLANKVYY